MTSKKDVDALLADAGKSTSLLLRAGSLQRVENGGDRLRQLLLANHAVVPTEKSIVELSRDVGHAPRWIDAGGVYEDLIEDRGSADFIFCLDPWAAQLLSRAKESAPEAKWVLVSDPHPNEYLEYWKSLDRWLSSLPWSMVIPRNLISTATKNLVLENDWGIGDELLLSAVAREFTRAHPDASIWIRSRHGFRFPKYVRRDPVPNDARVVNVIYQNPTLYGPENHSPYPGHLVQQMLDKVALDTGLQARAVDVRPELELPTVEAREPRTVILHSRPNPRLSSKDWGLDRWKDLATLLIPAGVRLLQVGGKEEPILPEAEDLRGLPPSELPEVFCRTSAVVCVAGLLMHLAEATKTPAVVIYGGREHPVIDGYPDQVHLSSGPLPCRGRWGCHLGADTVCSQGMKCMDQITPALVARRVLTALGEGGRW